MWRQVIKPRQVLHAVGGRGKLRIKRQFLLFLWMFTYKDIHITAGIIAKRKTVLSRQYTRSPLLCLQLDSPPLFLCPGAVVLLVWFLCCSAGVERRVVLKGMVIKVSPCPIIVCVTFLSFATRPLMAGLRSDCTAALPLHRVWF